MQVCLYSPWIFYDTMRTLKKSIKGCYVTTVVQVQSCSSPYCSWGLILGTSCCHERGLGMLGLLCGEMRCPQRSVSLVPRCTGLVSELPVSALATFYMWLYEESGVRTAQLNPVKPQICKQKKCSLLSEFTDFGGVSYTATENSFLSLWSLHSSGKSCQIHHERVAFKSFYCLFFSWAS